MGEEVAKTTVGTRGVRVEYWAGNVRAGKRRYEVRGVEEKRAKRALEKAGKKRPIRTKRVERKWSR